MGVRSLHVRSCKPQQNTGLISKRGGGVKAEIVSLKYSAEAKVTLNVVCKKWGSTKKDIRCQSHKIINIAAKKLLLCIGNNLSLLHEIHIDLEEPYCLFCFV